MATARRKRRSRALTSRQPPRVRDRSHRGNKNKRLSRLLPTSDEIMADETVDTDRGGGGPTLLMQPAQSGGLYYSAPGNRGGGGGALPCFCVYAWMRLPPGNARTDSIGSTALAYVVIATDWSTAEGPWGFDRWRICCCKGWNNACTLLGSGRFCDCLLQPLRVGGRGVVGSLFRLLGLMEVCRRRRSCGQRVLVTGVPRRNREA